ncbi:hypothetical protein ILUMI_01332 [Ignelater luminosus]|uniref:ODAD1 central coiled coil region domain-containing protein n=1 Tax=Ignelater luminosus TaxID=2038154 RepID=A0A8K0GMD2_IGNLU|nr:hypothetical protein ILUMI_01332 [Ignelater luminosus]
MAKKSKKPLTVEEQLELDLQLESELARLQRQHRLMERDRSGYSSGGKLAKQRRVIQILQKEQNNVLTDLNVATCSTKKKQDAEVTANLCALLGEHDSFQGMINEKKAHLHEIDIQIEMVKKQVIEMRAKQVTDEQYQARVLQGQKTVEGLENKLDTVIKRFCTIMTENRKMREEIDHLLLERINFNKIWEKLISNLNKGKSFMMDLIEQATIAYDQREEWCSKLQALRMRAHSDLMMHTQEMQELQRKLDHDGKLEEFLAVKGQKRLMKDLEEKEQRKREQRRENMQKQLNEYKEMLAHIMEATGVEDIDSLAIKFAKQEEENFAVFNYINVLHKEIEEITDELVQLHKEIDEQTELNNSRASQQTTTLTKLKHELQSATFKADNTQNDLNKTQNKLSQMYSGIDKLFKIVKCSNAPFLELLGDNTTINDYNVLLYLEMLEQRVSELIMNVYYKQKTAPKKTKTEAAKEVIKENEFARPVYPINDIVPTNPCPLCVELENVQDVIDTLQFVQERPEVKIKLHQRLQLPDGLERLHNVSACHLPKSRQIIQRRYQ